MADFNGSLLAKHVWSAGHVWCTLAWDDCTSLTCFAIAETRHIQGQ